MNNVHKRIEWVCNDMSVSKLCTICTFGLTNPNELTKHKRVN